MADMQRTWEIYQQLLKGDINFVFCYYFIVGCCFSYEKSETHQFEVPRMLLETPDLEEYVLKSQDKLVAMDPTGPQ